VNENPPRRSSPVGPSRPAPVPNARRLPEPPVLRANPLAGARACSSCATPIGGTTAPPRCWGCGRPLCTDCYWRHGLTPTAHRCTSCLMQGAASRNALSGGRSTAPSGPLSSRALRY